MPFLQSKKGGHIPEIATRRIPRVTAGPCGACMGTKYCLKTPLGSLSWDPLSVRRARAVAPLGEARIPQRCFAVSNKNVPQQLIRIGSVSELNKSEPMDERLLQKSTLVWAIGKNMVALPPRISPIPKNACAAFLKTKGGTIIRRPTSLEATRDAVLAP